MVVHCLNKELEGGEACIVTDYSIIQGSSYTKYFCEWFDKNDNKKIILVHFEANNIEKGDLLIIRTEYFK